MSELSLEYVEAMQGSFFTCRTIVVYMRSNDTMSMNLHHMVENSLIQPVSAYFWECITRHHSNFRGFVAHCWRWCTVTLLQLWDHGSIAHM